jgi:hypothetical protein
VKWLLALAAELAIIGSPKKLGKLVLIDIRTVLSGLKACRDFARTA